ncbi:FAD-dependent oxidoreductase [Chryseolinea lacunae]|uniref:FAD-dependent oxidoreductase n=1 Tax=Chryseolinea lacunae TaxID=2801331 RepID=A0ABS1KUL6_9BACT|nr:FAD-dependent oxidoreductase [Chryseolinea lacunae]MBL0743109.1 FAD-dependent oxidoreductase [Chryseolinea lacunae]
MIIAERASSRSFQQKLIASDLVVVGGGLAGACCAITAAREGIKVTLVQDRPVLGGNASSEVRLWVLGATSHMGNNNRWAREGGVIDEILVENMYRNPEGNAVIFDTVLLDKVTSEPNITLLLNTAVMEVQKSTDDTISGVKAFCSQNSVEYMLIAPLFCDASGDGVLGFLSGAAFRMGAESREELGEKFAPTKDYGELLGHSLYFYSKDTGKPVNFVAPSYALEDITSIPRYRKFNTKEFGCNLWWIEYGGRLDTVHETETIKWELWRVVYGVWNHIKNSGQFPEARNLTLEWVGTIPGKRESRRFEGDYMLRQQDIVEQREHKDAVAFGGWSIDLHPADGVFSEKPGCNQWHGKGIYQIPYRSYYSRNIKNLFFAGRIISVSHVAFGSARVMGTSAYGGQAVGMAAVLCKRLNVLPAALGDDKHMKTLQQMLMRSGQHIPGLTLADPEDLMRTATVSASSVASVNELPEEGLLKTLDPAVAQMLPVSAGSLPVFTVHAQTTTATSLEVELRICSKTGSYTPDVVLEQKTVALTPGRNCVKIAFDTVLASTQYVFITFRKNPAVQLHFTSRRVTGVLSVFNLVNEAVSNYGKQEPPEDIGIDAFEFWCPQRRPEGQNLAIKMSEPLKGFEAENIRNGIARPTDKPNAWVADLNDKKPTLTLTWQTPKIIRNIVLKFDTDFDHPMESVLMGHPENVMPFCVRRYVLRDDEGRVVYEKTDNHQTMNVIRLATPMQTRQLTLEVEHPSANVPAAVFEVLCYEN